MWYTGVIMKNIASYLQYISLRSVLLTALVGLLIFTLVVPGRSEAVTASAAALRCGPARLVGHRGTAQANVRPNTIAALRGAVAGGAEALEIDIHRSKSGVWVVNHDASIKGKKISKTSFAKLRKVAPDLPTVRQAIAYAKSVNKVIYIEIKPSKVGKGSLRYFSRLVKEYGMQGKVSFTSFHSKVLKKYLRVKGHAGTTGYIVNTRLPSSASSLASYAKKVRKFSTSITLRYASATPANVAALKRAGLEVYVYTTDASRSYVDTSSYWTRYLGYGATGIITDKVATYTQWCNGLSA